MIKSFSVTNFRSISEKVTVDFEKSKRKKGENDNYSNDKKIALSTVFYGANASGKSNILKALAVLKYLIKESARFQPGSSINAYMPFRLNKKFLKEPTTFEIEFYIKDTLYRYMISFNEKEIVKEKLDYFPSRRTANLFTRNKNEIHFGEYFKGEKKAIQKLLLPNQLFVSKGAENNIEGIIPIFNFFSKDLLIYNLPENSIKYEIPSFLNFIKLLYPIQEFEDILSKKLIQNKLAEIIAKKYDSSPSRKLRYLISSLDTGIQDILSKKEEDLLTILSASNPKLSKLSKLDVLNYHLKTMHLNNEKKLVEFDIDDESEGTKNLIAIGTLIITALEMGKVLIVDEFEKNLHPLISSYLVKLFHQKDLTNKKNAQLIFATHDVTLMDKYLFNRDQIWLVEKNEFGSTEVYRCSDIEGLRLEAPLEKWYLSGRLGGTAIINDINFLLEYQNEK